MSPYELAKDVYENEPCVRTFEEDLRLHLLNGYVYSTRDYFVMGRPVCSDWSDEMIVDPGWNVGSEFADTWHVYLIGGNMQRALSVVPYYLPLISFERKNKLRFYDFLDVQSGILRKERLTKV